MSDVNEQTVTDESASAPETVTGTQDAGTESGAQDSESKSVEELLREFETVAPREPVADEASNVTVDDLREVVAHVRDQRTQGEAQAFRQAIDDSVAVLKEDPRLANLSNTMLEGLLHARGQDKTFNAAFANRDVNPGTWNAVLKALAREEGAKLESRPDKEVTESREALRAAVSGQSATPPSKTKFDSSDVQRWNENQAEFRKDRAAFLANAVD